MAEDARAEMLVAVIAIGLGTILLFDWGRISERMAQGSRQSPWWLKGPLADYSIAWRLFGGLLIAIGVSLALVSLVWRPF
jgi:hypothetical protein